MLKVANQNKPIYTPTDSTYTKLLLHGNSLNDCSGNGHVVTANGDASYNNSGNPFGHGGAYSFDGTGDYLSIADSTDFAPTDKDFTFDAFIKFNSTASTALNWAGIFTKATDTSVFSITFGLTYNWQDEGGWVFRSIVTDSGGIKTAKSLTLISDNIWYHVAARRSGNDYSVYVNGVKGTISEINFRNGTDNDWTGSTIDVPTSPYAIGNFNS